MKFSKNEWQFYRITDQAELRSVWRWELERAAGSGAKPWLALSKETRRRVRDYEEMENPPVKEKPLESITAEADALRDKTPLALHGFEIDWSRGKDAIASWFQAWARSKPHDKAKRQWTGWTKQGGRKNQYLPWLVDLAIYRADKAGIKPSQAETMLQPLIGWSFTKKKFSAIGWSKAKARTEQRIAENRKLNFSIARNLAGCLKLP